MATLDFDSLKTKYGGFRKPEVLVSVGGKKLPDKKLQYTIGDVDIELTSGFEASIAEFSIFDAYDSQIHSFETDKLQKYISLGSKVEIYLGYDDSVSLVFVGIIAKTSYRYSQNLGEIRITAMDMKCVMMSGSYSRQLKATEFTEAVKEIFEKPIYEKLKSQEIITDVKITKDLIAAPTGNSNGSSETIEMVAESDYEFIVKLAKKYNYDFFIENGTVYFRKAKSVTNPLFTMIPGNGFLSYNIEYDITGIAEKVIARVHDAGNAKLIQQSEKFSNKVSNGNKANNIFKGKEIVYVDPTITSEEEAKNRVSSIMEEMSYRLGTLDATLIGLPEMKPGYFLDLQNFGKGPSNVFYITSVRHVLSIEGGYETLITAKTNSMQ